MRLALILIAAAASTVAVEDYDYEESTPVPDTCEGKCLRIHERSLDRIGFSKNGADKYVDRLKTEERTLKEVCWKSYDYFYCMKGCPKTVEHEKYARHTRSKCRAVLEDMESGLACLYKYRKFLEIRCSSFMNRAVELKQADDPDLLPDKETCRYLHLNALCLENSVGEFCPQATPFFRRLNLRDYFLNFLLPEDDLLFDDQDLDACQLKDFVKEALEGVRVSPTRRSEEEEEEQSTTAHHSSTSTESAATPIYRDSDEDSAEETLTAPPAIVRTLSPSTRNTVQSSTAANFVYTTPRKHSTLIGTATTPIHVTREQAERVFEQGRGGEASTSAGLRRITVQPQPINIGTTPSSSEEETTTPGVTTSTRRRIFESEEDFSQTPPNFLWGSFRGENYKFAHNYSESFHPNEQFVTPLTLDSSTLFGDDDDDDVNDVGDYGSPEVIDIDRDQPATVTGSPVRLTTIVNLNDDKTKDGKRRKVEHREREENHSSPVYEHAVDTQLQPTTADILPITLESGESSTLSRVLPTDEEDDRDDDYDLPQVDHPESNKKTTQRPTIKDHPRDEKDVKYSEISEEEDLERSGSRVGPSVADKRQSAEDNFDQALANEKVPDSSETVTVSASEELLVTERAPVPFTPLINGGRVAVKAIKSFKNKEAEDSTQDWTEDPRNDDSLLDLPEEKDMDIDEYDKEFYVTSETRDVLEDEGDVRRRINFILAYTALFFLLLLFVVCCILCVIVRSRRNSHLENSYKMTNSL